MVEPFAQRAISHGRTIRMAHHQNDGAPTPHCDFSSPCHVAALNARRCVSNATLRHDRTPERSYLFTMSDITQPQARLTARLRMRKTFSCERAENPGWWSQTGSNRRPPACKAGALPTELWPLRRTEDRDRSTENAFRRLSSGFCRLIMVGLGRLELPTSRLSSARSNQLSYKPLARSGYQRGYQRRYQRQSAAGGRRASISPPASAP